MTCFVSPGKRAAGRTRKYGRISADDRVICLRRTVGPTAHKLGSARRADNDGTED